jgi:hypothetical protein
MRVMIHAGGQVSFVGGGLSVDGDAVQSRVRGDTLFKLFFFTLSPADLLVRDGHSFKIQVESPSYVCLCALFCGSAPLCRVPCDLM